MTKSKLFLDFDNSIVNATKAFCSQYNILYKDHPNFTPAQWELVDRYDFRDQCNLIQSKEEIEQIFAMKSFFDRLEFINGNTYNILERLSEKYQVIICSIGTPMNVALKSLWIKTHLPFIKDYILLVNEGCKMDKSIVKMDYDDAVFIDDVASNLDSSSCPTRICFGERHEWNRRWNGRHCLNWTEVANMLL